MEPESGRRQRSFPMVRRTKNGPDVVSPAGRKTPEAGGGAGGGVHEGRFAAHHLRDQPAGDRPERESDGTVAEGEPEIAVAGGASVKLLLKLQSSQ